MHWDLGVEKIANILWANHHLLVPQSTVEIIIREIQRESNAPAPDGWQPIGSGPTDTYCLVINRIGQVRIACTYIIVPSPNQPREWYCQDDDDLDMEAQS